MESKACSCSNLMIQWIPIPTAILLGFCCFFGFGFDQSIFITSIALILSTLFIYSRHSKKDSILRSNEHEIPTQQTKDDDNDDEDDDEEFEEDQNGVITSEDSEVEWPFTGEDQSLDFSDEGSISDEDSLIEIAIPTGHYVGCHYKKTPSIATDFDTDFPHLTRERMPKKMVDFSADSIFQRSNVMDDEDNLIEIDISMGLIKCSRFSSY